MKNFKRIIFLLSLTFFNCTGQKNVKISGQIKNALEQERFITFFTTDNSFSKVINLNEDNSFQGTLNISKDDNIVLKYGQRFVLLYVEKGGDLHIELDNNATQQGINFSGSLSEINTYLTKKQEISNDYFKGKINHLLTIKEDTFLEILKNWEEKLNTLIPQKSSSFVNFEKNNLLYEKMHWLEIYKSIKANPANDKSEDLDKINTIIHQFDYQNAEKFENSSNYQNLCIAHYFIAVNIAFRKNNDVKSIFKIIDGIKLKKLKEKVIKNLVQSNIFQDLENAKQLVAYVKENNLNEELQAYVSNYKKSKEWEVKNKLPKGSPSPKFIGFENFKGGTTSIDDLKGSYLYIDVWASWCLPCISQIPSLKKLKKEFKGKNIKFIGISTDKNKDAWKAMVKEQKLKGTQLWQTNTDFARAYSINSIPRFIIIDPKGNIVDSDATRPSQPQTKKILMDLIK